MPKHILDIRGTLATGILFTSSRKLKCFSAINHSSGFDSKTKAIQRPSHAEFEVDAGAWRTPSCRCNQNEAGYMPPRKACPASAIISKCSLGCCCQQQKRMRSSAFTFVENESLRGSCTFDCTLALIPGLAIPVSWLLGNALSCDICVFAYICYTFIIRLVKIERARDFCSTLRCFFLFFFTCDSRALHILGN